MKGITIGVKWFLLPRPVPGWMDRTGRRSGTSTTSPGPPGNGTEYNWDTNDLEPRQNPQDPTPESRLQTRSVVLCGDIEVLALVDESDGRENVLDPLGAS